VFLKSLTLKGFKSFADATTLEFEPGVTVVVGPNGSGKSNIVDAVAWVLGAQGPRTLRSAKMEDVIFAGTPKRPALGRAEVSLTIDNSSGALRIEFSEVTITRTLFRNGDSEYAINAVPCRLLDVQELLSDTGVGRQQHVIVSQGNLDAVLNARPEERRLIIEEAAGILKYRRRKERAERRLEATEGSLTRLEDLLREVRRQLRPLQRQADAARRHGDLVAELVSVRRYLAGRELGAIETHLASAARSRADLAAAETEVKSALGRLDAEVAGGEAELTGRRDREQRTDLGEALSRAEGLRGRAQGLVAVLGERRRSVERDRAAFVDEGVVASLEAEAADLASQLESAEEEERALGPQAEEVAAAEAALAAATADVERRWAAGAGPAPANPLAEVRGELSALRAMIERGTVELRRLEARASAAAQRAQGLGAEVDRLRSAVQACDTSAGDLAGGAERATVEAAAGEAAVLAAEDERRRAEADHHRWSARVEALSQALDEASARAGMQRLAQVEGVVGTLAAMVDVTPGLEVAFEAAAGEAAASVVVDGSASARRALAELATQGVAGSVVPLPAGDRPAGIGLGARPRLEGLPEGSQWLRSHVTSRLPAGDALLDWLLASAVVVPGDWQEAVDVASYRPDLVVVTRRGDRCSGGVWRAGGTATGATGAALEQARHHGRQAAATAERAKTAAEAAAGAARRLRQAAADAQRAVEANRSRRQAATDALRRAEAQLEEAGAEAEGSRSAAEETAARIIREQQRAAALEAGLPELERAAAADAERAVAERAVRARLGEQAAATATLRREFEVRAAALAERRTVLSRRRAEVESRLRGVVDERERAARRRGALESQAVAIERLLAVVTGHADDLAETVEWLRRERRQEAEATREVTERLDQLRRQRAAAERQLEQLRERAGRAEVDEAESRLRLQTLTEAIRRDLDCEPDATRGAPCPPLPAATSAQSRVRELERELRLMGPVNPLALEEYAALEERHQFLQGQLDDVRAARRDLTKVIRAVDAEIVEVFRAAWADVADNFETLFATLFPGGHGRLRLTEPDHLLDTGVEIEARPSGKNVRRLSLLSGGERSLTALAYLFAVFRSRPSPFYLMDEVEAALDDVNLHRFLDLLHEFRAEAQLLVVSHQKRTMEAADCLYGVTMAPGGSSRVISERVDDHVTVATT
jgi:chromosome segregation protein